MLMGQNCNSKLYFWLLLSENFYVKVLSDDCLKIQNSDSWFIVFVVQSEFSILQLKIPTFFMHKS